MILRLKRTYGDDETHGILYVNHVKYCTTIEPPQKITTDKGCIPEGVYEVAVTYSPRFKRLMPLICGVDGRSGIRIHAGRKRTNTTGCICVGWRDTEEDLTQQLLKAQNEHEEILIIIEPAWRAVE